MQPQSPTHHPLSRRRILSALIAAAGGGILTACGQPSTPAPATPAGGAPPTAGGAEAKPTGVSGGTPAAPTATIPAGAKVATFWIPWGQPERQKWVEDWGARFHEKYADHALKMEFVGFGNMRQRWIAAQQAGQMPEVLATTFPELGSA